MPLPCDDDLYQYAIYCIYLSLFISYESYPKVARPASLLPPFPLYTFPRIRGTADLEAADHVSCAATPGGCWLSSSPSQDYYDFVYICCLIFYVMIFICIFLYI